MYLISETILSLLFTALVFNEPLKTQIFCDGPQGTFCECVERASFIVGEVEEDPIGATLESPKHFLGGRALRLKL